MTESIYKSELQSLGVIVLVGPNFCVFASTGKYHTANESIVYHVGFYFLACHFLGQFPLDLILGWCAIAGDYRTPDSCFQTSHQILQNGDSLTAAMMVCIGWCGLQLV